MTPENPDHKILELVEITVTSQIKETPYKKQQVLVLPKRSHFIRNKI